MGSVFRPSPAPAPAPQPPRPKPKPVIQDIDPTDPAYSTKRRGRRSTILTTPDYEETDATTNQPTLLGG